MRSGQFSNNAKTILSRINSAQNIFLATHENPDGDAVSSLCALGELLYGLQKKFYLFCVDQPPDRYEFLPNFNKIKNTLPPGGLDDFDLIILTDCAIVSRSGLAAQLGSWRNKNLISFDHHPMTEDPAGIELRDDQSASTTEVLYDFFKINKIKISKNIADCILTGILTDTGNFIYPTTSGRTIEISSEMLSRGAKMPQILDKTWRNKSLEAMKLWGSALLNLQINPKYNIAYSVITPEELKAVSENDAELDGVAGFLSNLYGVKGVLFLRDEGKGLIIGNLRTARSDLDISKLARALGGGGHVKASGFKISGSLQRHNNTWKII